MNLEHTHQHGHHFDVSTEKKEFQISATKKTQRQHDHVHMVEDFRKRFWLSLVLTLPILILSPTIQEFVGLSTGLRFAGDQYFLWAFSSIVFFYGGFPFLKGFSEELVNRKPGMMTLIALAISTAYFYSTAVVFGLAGMGFFWELVSLIDIMLLGHWIEMKSVMGASRALEELARLMPSVAFNAKALKLK